MGRPRRQAGRSPPARANMAPRNTAVNFSPPPPPPSPPPAPCSPRIREQKLQASRLRRTAPIFPRSALSPAGRRRGAVPPLPLHAARRAGRRGGGPGSGEGWPPSPPSRPLAPARRSGTERSPACRPPRRRRGRSPSTLRSLTRSPGLRLRRARTGAGIQPSSFSSSSPGPAWPPPRAAPARLRAPAAPPASSGGERAGGQRAARTQTAAGERWRRGGQLRLGRGAGRGRVRAAQGRPWAGRGVGRGEPAAAVAFQRDYLLRCFARTPPPPFWVRYGCRSNTGPGGTGLLSVTERRPHKDGRSPPPAGAGCPAGILFRPSGSLPGGGSRVKGGLWGRGFFLEIAAELPRGQSYFSIFPRNAASHEASLLSSRNSCSVE